MSDIPPPLEKSADETEWHYALDGERHGPVSGSQIDQLITQAKITRESKVWRKGFIEWREVHLTEFSHHFESTPPELTGDSVSNLWVWINAFVPMVSGVIRYSMATEYLQATLAGHHPDAPNFFLHHLSTFVVNSLLCHLDEKVLRKAGHDTGKFKGWIWLVPVYMFIRAKKLKQNQAPFIVWIVLFVLFVA